MFLQFIFSLLLLLNGSNFLINGALSVGKRLNVSNLVLGIFVVALGTSLPELFVLISSIFKSEPLLGVVNIFSSSIFNLCLILAISSFFVKIDLKERVLNNEIPYNLFFSFMTRSLPLLPRNCPCHLHSSLYCIFFSLSEKNRPTILSCYSGLKLLSSFSLQL